MPEGVLVADGSTASGRPSMHSTAPFSSHRRRSARVPVPGPGSASGCLVRMQFLALHQVLPREKTFWIRVNYHIVLRETASLIPYVNNSRTHTEAQIAQIAASIKEFGFTNPVLLDGESGIVAGHARVIAARLLKMAQVPWIELCYLTEAQRKAYVIADNKLALNAGSGGCTM
jgi:hypothetical protein